MAENKKFSANWGGKREGAGAKKILPTGARTRSIRMTDGEYKKIKEYLSELRSTKNGSR
jgi:hypothetical protein